MEKIAGAVTFLFKNEDSVAITLREGESLAIVGLWYVSGYNVGV